MSVPNQNKIIIHQSKEIPFLKIGTKEIMDAYQQIDTPSAFILYLYLASNKDGYTLELSKVAFKNATGYSRSSYYRAIERLTKLGYIYEDNCGRLNFATKPKEGLRKATQNWESNDAKSKHISIKKEMAESQNCNSSVSNMNTEINKINNNKNNKKIDNQPFYSLKHLRTIIAPTGEYIGGDKKGQWLEDEFPSLWTYVRLNSDDLTAKIAKYSDFDWFQSMLIVDYILDWNARKEKNRDGVSLDN